MFNIPICWSRSLSTMPYSGKILQVESENVLKTYADRIAKAFDRPLPSAPEASSSAEWLERAEAAAKGR